MSAIDIGDQVPQKRGTKNWPPGPKNLERHMDAPKIFKAGTPFLGPRFGSTRSGIAIASMHAPLPPFGSPPPLSSRVFNLNTQIIIFGKKFEYLRAAHGRDPKFRSCS